MKGIVVHDIAMTEGGRRHDEVTSRYLSLIMPDPWHRSWIVSRPFARFAIRVVLTVMKVFTSTLNSTRRI